MEVLFEQVKNWGKWGADDERGAIKRAGLRLTGSGIFMLKVKLKLKRFVHAVQRTQGPGNHTHLLRPHDWPLLTIHLFCFRGTVLRVSVGEQLPPLPV